MSVERQNIGSSLLASRVLALRAGSRADSTAGIFLWLSEVRRVCGTFEWVTLSYLAWLMIVMILFHKNLHGTGERILVHSLLVAAVPLIAWAARRWPGEQTRFLHSWYFLPLWLFLFEELGGLVHLIFPGWFDRWLIHFDHALTGVYPWEWLARFASPSMNDLMQFAYLTYFLALVSLPGILYAKREGRAFWAVLSSMAVAHYTVYVIAVLLPIESPFHVFVGLRSSPLAGGAVTSLINLIERFGRVHGAAFPSAHVAGAFAALLGAWRYRRWLFWVHLPVFALMLISTVYGRYHYVGDGLAGLLVGAIGFRAGLWLCARQDHSLEFELQHG